MISMPFCGKIGQSWSAIPKDNEWMDESCSRYRCVHRVGFDGKVCRSAVQHIAAGLGKYPQQIGKTYPQKVCGYMYYGTDQWISCKIIHTVDRQWPHVYQERRSQYCTVKHTYQDAIKTNTRLTKLCTPNHCFIVSILIVIGHCYRPNYLYFFLYKWLLKIT